VALGAFVAGRYATQLDGLDLGITREGYKLVYSPKAKKIDKTDLLGETLFDTIQLGGDWSLSCDSLEYIAGPLGALTQFMGTLGDVGPIGSYGTTNLFPLSMTVTSGTSAQLAGNAINSLTTAQANLAPNADISLMFDSTLREFPIRLVLLPFLSGGTTIRHFTTS